jgi:hypothetical protein
LRSGIQLALFSLTFRRDFAGTMFVKRNEEISLDAEPYRLFLPDFSPRFHFLEAGKS